MSNRILVLTEDPVVSFAAEELGRHLQIMSGQLFDRAVVPADDSGAAGLRLGTFVDVETPRPAVVEDPAADDAVAIHVRQAQGTIAGSNPRSVLLGVYRFLHELGCRWLRPGEDGAIIPPCAVEAMNADLAESAAYRHRGICIEGAVSYEHVRDIVDWLPKVGFNAYFIQFREAHTFFDRWYSHALHPTDQGEPLSVERARALTHRVEEEIARRGLLYHAVGHGWTCEPFGIPGLGWEPYDEPIPDETKRFFAEVNGKRELWGGVPLNTNLCYSNPVVRRTVVSAIVEHCTEHPEVHYLHFWLADGTNNHCECESCRTMRPAGWYVRMLNELDAAMTEAGVATKVVFLIYVDLLWPPEHERIANPDRFVLMFAPITRVYHESFSPREHNRAIPPFERNHLSFPRSPEANVGFLHAWQEQFRGDSFDFDYHYWVGQYRDPGSMTLAGVLHEDIRGLARLGLNGYVSCQTQRAFLPTGFGVWLMGQTLWQSDRNYEALRADYFKSAFGADWQQVVEYLQTLSRLFHPEQLGADPPHYDAEALEDLAALAPTVEGFRATVRRNLESQHDAVGLSWKYLDIHGDICIGLAGALQSHFQGRKDQAVGRWQELESYLWQKEPEIHSVLDVYLLVRVGRSLFAGA